MTIVSAAPAEHTAAPEPRARGPWLSRLSVGLAVLSLMATAASSTAYTLTLRREADPQPVYPWLAFAQLALLFVLGVCVLIDARSLRSPASWPGRRSLVAWTGSILLAAALSSRFGLSVALLTALVTLGLGWLVSRSGSRAPVLAGVALLALWLRLGAAWGLSLFGLTQYGIPVAFDDERAYQQAGVPMAHILASGYGALIVDFQNLQGTFLDLIGLAYLVGGSSFVLIRTLNVALGVGTVLLLMALAAAHAGRRAALVAGVAGALWPTLVLWSGSGLREPLLVLVSLLPLWFLARRRSRPTVLGVAGAVLAWVALLDLRPPFAIALAVALAGAGLSTPLLRRWRPRPMVAAAGAASGLVLLGLVVALSQAGFGPLGIVRQVTTPRELEYRAAAAELTPLIEHQAMKLPPRPSPGFLALGTVVRVPDGGPTGYRTGMTASYTYTPPGYVVLFGADESATYPPRDVQPLTDENVSWLDIAARGLSGFKLFFVPPLPGSASARELLVAPDTLLWDALVVATLIAAWRRRGALGPLDVALLVYPLLVVIGLGVTSTNLGTVVRHRSTLVPWLILSAAPLVATALPERAPHGLRLPWPANVRAAHAPRPQER